MSKFYSLMIFFLLGVTGILSAQEVQIHTVIRDAHTHAPLQNVEVKVNPINNPNAVRLGITDAKGIISLAKMNTGDHAMRIHNLGYPDTLIHFSIRQGSFKTLPDTISLSSGNGIQLKEVTIKDNTPPVSMKGDTVEYNASKFKTKENAVVEDLLRKLPGVSVDKTGTIKAQGETVQRVLVDGKEFFGSDPSIATRNLPADMIDKVQVLDKKSDMAEFTGVADGKQMKTINLITKKNRKRGYFGNATAGAGNEKRYEGGMNVNSFINDLQFSALLKGNNVNKSGFSATELINLLTQNKEMFNNLPPAALSELMNMKGVKIQGSGDALAEIARPIGLTDTKFGGLNFNNDWGNKLKLRSSYFFNESNTQNEYDYARQYLLQAEPYNYLQAGTTASRNKNQRIDLSADVKLDDRTSIKITPHVDINNTHNDQSRTFRSFTTAGLRPLNEGRQNSTSIGAYTLATTDILLRHRMEKPGRTIVLNVTPEYFGNNTNFLNQSTSNLYDLLGNKSAQLTDQQTANNSNVYSVKGNLVYTEPMFEAHSLQAGQQIYYSHGQYDRQVNDKNTATGNYDLLDTRFTDTYSSNKSIYTSKLSLAGNYKKFQYTIGAGWQQSRITGLSTVKNYEINKHYQALLPSVYAELKTDAHDKLIFRYAMETNMPTIGNLQPIEDNNDPLYTRRGNPDLDQEKSQRLSISFNSFEVDHGNSFYASANLNWFNSQISDNTITNPITGKQLITPINVHGNYTTGLNIGKTIGIKKDGSSLTTEVSANYSRSMLFNNGLSNNMRTLSITPEVTLNYYLSNSVSFTAKGSAAWNSRRFSGPTSLPEKNWLLTYSLDNNIILPFKMSLESSFTGFSTPGLSSGYNNTILLLNTSLTKEIAKQFSLRIDARDLLNKNLSINRITGNGFIEDRRNNALGRYFLLSAVYKFRHFPKAKTDK